MEMQLGQLGEDLSVDALARIADLPRAEQTAIALALGPAGLEEAMRVVARAQGTAGAGLGRNIFEKIGDFIQHGLKEVTKAVAPIVAPFMGPAPTPPVVVQAPPPAAPAQPATPAWVAPVVIGGGLLVLVLLLRRKG